MPSPYADQWPQLCKVTNNLDPLLLVQIGKNLDQQSIDVQVEYHSYQQFQREYEDWLDQQTKPNYLQDY